MEKLRMVATYSEFISFFFITVPYQKHCRLSLITIKLVLIQKQAMSPFFVISS